MGPFAPRDSQSRRGGRIVRAAPGEGRDWFIRKPCHVAPLWCSAARWAMPWRRPPAAPRGRPARTRQPARSSASATPWRMPMHTVARPIRPPVRPGRSATLPAMHAPDMPNAMAPPFGARARRRPAIRGRAARRAPGRRRTGRRRTWFSSTASTSGAPPLSRLGSSMFRPRGHRLVADNAAKSKAESAARWQRDRAALLGIHAIHLRTNRLR